MSDLGGSISVLLGAATGALICLPGGYVWRMFKQFQCKHEDGFTPVSWDGFPRPSSKWYHKQKCLICGKVRTWGGA